MLIEKPGVGPHSAARNARFSPNSTQLQLSGLGGAGDDAALLAPPATDNDLHLLQALGAVGIGDEVEHIHVESVSTSAVARWDTAQVTNADRLAREFFPASTPPAPPSGLAIASLALGVLTVGPALLALLIRSGGVLAVLLYLGIVGVPALLAIVFGHIAKSAVKRGERRGRGMAAAGLALGYFAIVAPLLAALIAGAGGGQ